MIHDAAIDPTAFCACSLQGSCWLAFFFCWVPCFCLGFSCSSKWRPRTPRTLSPNPRRSATSHSGPLHDLLVGQARYGKPVLSDLHRRGHCCPPPLHRSVARRRSFAPRALGRVVPFLMARFPRRTSETGFSHQMTCNWGRWSHILAPRSTTTERAQLRRTVRGSISRCSPFSKLLFRRHDAKLIGNVFWRKVETMSLSRLGL